MSHGRIVLQSAQFREEREAKWRELEQIVVRVERRGLRSLTAKELHDLPVLYRGVISSLSVARSISLDRNVVEYLEALSRRAYFVVYSPRRRAREVVGEFFARSFPRAVRELRVWILIAFGLSLLATSLSYRMVRADLDDYFLFVDPGLAQGRDPSASREELRAVLMNEEESDHETGLAEFAAFLFSHNAQIGLLCYALGVIPVVLVVWLLFSNFLMLGAFAGLHAERGLSLELWSWLLPHGVTELGAVILCAGAGLAVGMSWFFPGSRTRRESALRAGRQASVVAVGCVSMFFVAALIEGFFRQLVNDLTVRYLVAAMTGVLWTLYFVRAGRERPVTESRGARG